MSCTAFGVPVGILSTLGGSSMEKPTHFDEISHGADAKEPECRNFGSRQGARNTTSRHLEWLRRCDDPRKALGYRRPVVG